MSGLHSLAHRIIGKVNISAKDEEPEYIGVSKVLFRDMDANPHVWIITECLGWDSDITPDDIIAVRQLGEVFTDWTEVCKRYNDDAFDASEWEVGDCVCGECPEN